MSQTVAMVAPKEELARVVAELPAKHVTEILDFALFVKEGRARRLSESGPQPVQRLEDLWGSFWPQDESVDDFIKTVRRWRNQDVALHRDLR